MSEQNVRKNESQFESSVTRVSLNQFGLIDHSGHCWTRNQEKGRGGEDNSDEI